MIFYLVTSYYGNGNDDGLEILDVSYSNDLCLENTYFYAQVTHFMTLMSWPKYTID